MREFKIGRVKFTGERTVVIAEAGVNHLGRFDYAENLIVAAARAGADIVKFQTYKANNLTTRTAPRFWNWEGEEKKDGSQFDSYSKLDSFGEEEHLQLRHLCEKHNIEFMSTPFDLDSVDMLERVGAKGFKIASGDITNIPLLRKVASTGLPILLSTGASTIEEIEKAVTSLESNGSKDIAILHCTLTYPTPPEHANLLSISAISQAFPNYLVGLSDHTLGVDSPALAVALGARVIEKHFTFDKTLPDSADHWLSVDEQELFELVARVRYAEQALGSGEKQVMPSELVARQNARRSLVAATSLPAGTVLTESHIAVKRPGTGLPPALLPELVGQVLTVAVEEDHIFDLETDMAPGQL